MAPWIISQGNVSGVKHAKACTTPKQNNYLSRRGGGFSVYSVR